MSAIKIVHFDQNHLDGFYHFAKLVHPQEKGLNERLKWFTFGNPLNGNNPRLPGLAVVTQDNEVIGQFLMSPFEFYLRGKKYAGHFGYDFFVKEEYRMRGAGALLFVQGVRMYKPFIGVGLTQIVEKISKAAGIQVIGQLRKYIWTSNPLILGGKLLKTKLMGSSSVRTFGAVDDRFPEMIESVGVKFIKLSQLPQGFEPSFSSETLEPVRTKEYLSWRWLESPWTYHVYAQESAVSTLYVVVRGVFYQGMKLLLIVDHRFEKEQWNQLDVILRAAKTIAKCLRLDGVVMASTNAWTDQALHRANFMAAGNPSSVIAYLPKEDFPAEVKSICLTMADADLDFSFGEVL